MNLLILDGPADPRSPRDYSYRGTYRAHPTYVDSLPREHKINQLFMWFLEEGGESGVVKDIRKAEQYAALLNSQSVSQPNRFEVVQAVTGDGESDAAGKLLGFDLSSGFSNSLLWWWGWEPRVGDSPSLSEPIRTLCNVVYGFYGPQRNEHGLFPTVGVASDCLAAMDALQHLCPDLFESENLRSSFRPVGLYLVLPDEEVIASDQGRVAVDGQDVVPPAERLMGGM